MHEPMDALKKKNQIDPDLLISAVLIRLNMFLCIHED